MKKPGARPGLHVWGSLPRCVAAYFVTCSDAVAEFFAAIAACGRDAREAIKTLLAAVDFLEA